MMKLYAKANGATINDLILTAYYRAMSKMGEPIYDEPMVIPITIDLRRYLPNNKTDAIRNFSGSDITRLSLVPNESFDDTLKRVVAMMTEIKNSNIALQSAIGLERVENMTLTETLAYYKKVSQWSYYSGNKCAPVLSNLGYVADALISFGQITATNAYVVPPVVRPPGILLMVSTYNGILTLAAGFYDLTIEKPDVLKLIYGIRDELSWE